jgi:hypothetical protein
MIQSVILSMLKTIRAIDLSWDNLNTKIRTKILTATVLISIIILPKGTFLIFAALVGGARIACQTKFLDTNIEGLEKEININAKQEAEKENVQ